MRLEQESGQCMNPDCPQGSTSWSGNASEMEINTYFNFGATLSDCTGSVSNCRMVGDVAEQFLGCKVREINILS